jgi:hypothetical protein
MHTLQIVWNVIKIRIGKVVSHVPLTWNGSEAGVKLATLNNRVCEGSCVQDLRYISTQCRRIGD